MKIKRILIWLLIFAMCFALAACGSSKTENIAGKSSAPLLYRVTGQNGNVVWLFGSIHVGREDYYPLPDYVMTAFESADTLAVELDIVAFEKDMSQQVAVLQPLVYTDGTTIKDHIPQELYEKAVGIFEAYHTYASALDLYCPAFWSSLIDSLMVEEFDVDINLGLDRYFINAAYDAKKEIAEVESAEFQYQMLADFDEAVQIAILEASVESYENMEETADDLETLMHLWSSGDENAFGQYLTETDDSLTDEEKQISEKYNEIMITNRNIAMADYAETALAGDKEVFICVGAAHIVGEGAMANLLAQRGYTVERILTE